MESEEPRIECRLEELGKIQLVRVYNSRDENYPLIKNNRPQYVVVSEERYQELIEAEEEAYTARIKSSLEDVRAGRVRKFKSADELLKAIDKEAAG
ncbi:MAG: hypothetical protein MRJ65_13310 [Candidatus Brocadiaceae bacterium]|nr:hypothetical protein [Candidatus Brocadiaceae bacterium]